MRRFAAFPKFLWFLRHFCQKGQNNLDKIVIGADSVIDLENEIISKPKNRYEALEILKKLNGKTHFLISSVCISKNGSMIWHYTDKAELKMKTMTEDELKIYLFLFLNLKRQKHLE